MKWMSGKKTVYSTPLQFSSPVAKSSPPKPMLLKQEILQVALPISSPNLTCMTFTMKRHLFYDLVIILLIASVLSSINNWATIKSVYNLQHAAENVTERVDIIKQRHAASQRTFIFFGEYLTTAELDDLPIMLYPESAPILVNLL